MNKKSVLIVDDSLTVRQQVSMVLFSDGYNAVEACDGIEAVEALKKHTNIAMVLCDVTMPRMTGLQFLEAIKGDSPALPVPVVMLTTDGSPELIARAKRAGAKGWIVKPFQDEMLRLAVRRIAGSPE